MKKEALVISVLLVVLIWCSGCVGSSGSAPQATTPTTAPATAAPVETTTEVVKAPVETTAATPAATTVATLAAAPESQPSVLLAVNSVQKQTKIYTMNPKSGNVFLVLDITVKNNNIKDGYEFTDKSITVSSPNGAMNIGESLTTKVRGGLDNPILTPTTIEMNDKRTGQVAFSVPMNSGKYILHLVDNKGVELSTETVTV